MKTEVENFYVSYSDMVTLLLIFFVYLFSLSEIDPVKYLEAQNSINKEIKATVDTRVLDKINQEKKKLQQMQNEIQKFIKENQLEKQVSVDFKNNKLELNMGDTVLFGVGSAELKVDAKNILEKISSFFKTSTSKIVVEGHTDDRPIRTSQFPSNWELSAARAASVVHFIEDQDIEPNRFLVVGYNQYLPIALNDSEENRAKNRRVKITLQVDVEKIMKDSQKARHKP